MPVASLALVGTGLIGASIGLRARERGVEVAAWDADPEALEAARARGALDRALASLDELGAVDVLALATPLDVTLGLLERFRRWPPRAALVVDVASVKGPVARTGVGLANFVATHPLAGSERSGAQAARADLFDGRVWTYDPKADAEAVRRAKVFIGLMGARPFPVDSDLHDRIVALTSHLPQVYAVALGAQLAPALRDDAVVALCGPGMRSSLRLASSPWPMWRAVLSANRTPLAQEVRSLAGILSDVARALDSAEVDSLEPLFREAATAVARLSANAEPEATVH